MRDKGVVMSSTMPSAKSGWPRRITGTLILSGALANTSFVGLPMIETFYGKSFLNVGIVIDQLGSYMVLGTVGVLVAVLCAGDGHGRWRALIPKVAVFEIDVME
jgi:predicted permease